MAKKRRLFTATEKRIVVELYRNGLTDLQVSKLFNEEVTSFRKRCNYNDLSLVIKEAKELPNAEVERSLYKKATGFRYLEKHVEKKGDVVVSQKVVEREFPPDVAACTLWLCNRAKHRWKNTYSKALNEGAAESRAGLNVLAVVNNIEAGGLRKVVNLLEDMSESAVEAKAKEVTAREKDKEQQSA
jgi:hypothetical protein